MPEDFDARLNPVPSGEGAHRSSSPSLSQAAPLREGGGRRRPLAAVTPATLCLCSEAPPTLSKQFLCTFFPAWRPRGGPWQTPAFAGTRPPRGPKHGLPEAPMAATRRLPTKRRAAQVSSLLPPPFERQRKKWRPNERTTKSCAREPLLRLRGERKKREREKEEEFGRDSR